MSVKLVNFLVNGMITSIITRIDVNVEEGSLTYAKKTCKKHTHTHFPRVKPRVTFNDEHATFLIKVMEGNLGTNDTETPFASSYLIRMFKRWKNMNYHHNLSLFVISSYVKSDIYYVIINFESNLLHK